ncbi:MAG TPA: outer membrane beta-barrel protein [Acidobacteriaceae bacterium]|nr:outer membrane beta-barrel protein [Acidobacteriaceae bacterium]
MRTKTSLTAILLLSLAWLGAATAGAQTDVAGSIYGAFSGTTTGDGVQQSPGNSAGVLLEVRHIANPILGFEGTYSYNRADQTYASYEYACPVAASPCAFKITVPANAHEFTADWVPSVHIANFRPFGVLGIGALFNQPDSGTDTQTSTKAVYVYGAGLDWGVLPHIGLRFQYRGNLYRAPDVTTLYSSSDAFVHTAEPMIGVYFKL